MNRSLRLFIKKLAVSTGKLIPIGLRVAFLKLIVAMAGDEYKLIVAGSVSMFFQIKRLKKLGFNPTYILDIGAYEGEWSAEVASIFPQAHIAMFEAQPSKKEILEKFVSAHPQMEYQIGLLGASKKENILFYQIETGSSIYEENTPATKTEVRLNMQTLDQAMRAAETQIQPQEVVFAKLDVQGSELDILKGMWETLHNVEVLLVEVSLTEFNKGAPRFSELVTYLDSVDFCLYDFCEEKRTDTLQLFQLDMFFVKKHSEIWVKKDLFY